jgi:hypothetical protein
MTTMNKIPYDVASALLYDMQQLKSLLQMLTEEAQGIDPNKPDEPVEGLASSLDNVQILADVSRKIALTALRRLEEHI